MGRNKHIYNTNIKESQIVNDLLYESENMFLNNGIKNKYNILLKNVNSEGKNSTKYKDKVESELLSTFLFESSYPLIREKVPNFFKNYISKNFTWHLIWG